VIPHGYGDRSSSRPRRGPETAPNSPRGTTSERCRPHPAVGESGAIRPPLPITTGGPSLSGGPTLPYPERHGLDVALGKIYWKFPPEDPEALSRRLSLYAFGQPRHRRSLSGAPMAPLGGLVCQMSHGPGRVPLRRECHLPMLCGAASLGVVPARKRATTNLWRRAFILVVPSPGVALRADELLVLSNPLGTH